MAAKIWLPILFGIFVGGILWDGIARACEPPTVSVSIPLDSSGNESVGTKIITVALSSASPNTITVPFYVTGTATNGTDYSINCSSVTFNPNQTSKDITLTITDDAIDEDNETVIITLHDPVNATLGWPVSSRYTIIDNDNAPTITFSAGASNGTEGASGISIPVSLSASSGWPQFTVAYTVTGTATGGGVDHTLASGDLTFNPNNPNPINPIMLNTINDTSDEDNETIVVTLTANSKAASGAIMTYTYTINDNDNPPTISFSSVSSGGTEGTTGITIPVSLSASSGWPQFTVAYTVTGTASGGSVDHTLASGSLTFNPNNPNPINPITFNTIDDGLDEDNETIVVTLTANSRAANGAIMTHTYTIQDNDITAPTNLSVIADEATDPTTAMIVQWQDNSWNETDFLLERSPNGLDSWTSIIVPANAGVGLAKYIDHPPLIEGCHYWYRVRARKTQ